MKVIEVLEKRFVNHHNCMDLNSQLYIKTKIDDYQRKSIAEATICCEIASILAEINGTNEDTEHERLYNKFNLYKYN